MFLLGFLGGYLTKDKLPFNSSKDSIESQSVVTYVSKRAPYSFTHPTSFKVGTQHDSNVYPTEDRIDDINLGTERRTANGSDGVAYLVVTKHQFTDPSIEETVLAEYESAVAALRAYKDERELAPPLITPMKIGNAEGFKVIQQPIGTFASGDTKYYVDRRGIRYTIGTITTNEDELKELESILDTFNFSY